MSFGYRVLGFGSSEISLFPQENFALSDELLVNGTNALDVIGFAMDRHNRGKGAIAYRDGTNMRVKIFTTDTSGVITMGSQQTVDIGSNFRGDADQLAYFNDNKFAVGYIKNGDNQNQTTNGCMRFCTISGTTVTFGSEVVIRAAYTNGLQIACDTSITDRVAAMFVTTDSGGYRTKVIAATITETTPDFSGMTELTGDNGDSYSLAYHDNTCIATFKDHQNGYDGYATGLGISGKTIGKGDNVQYDTATHANSSFPAVNPNNNQECIVSNNNKSNSKPQMKIGSLNSNNITFGSFITASDKNVGNTKVRFNKLFNDKIVVFYDDEDESAADGVLRFKVGTIDGSSINFGDEITLPGSSTGHGGLLEFDYNDAGDDKFFYLYRNADNDTAIRVGQMGGRS